jgi:DNA mismatch repair protein MutS
MLVITGPNMGGKSTYMRQVALIALLAWCGSFVPARACTVGPIDRIFTRIGASDDLAGGRSTFMVEMTEAAAVLNTATERSLVLMDEIGRGTSTFDGLSLAHAIGRHLVARNRSLSLFATHYFELTQLAAEYAEATNVHMAAAEHDGGVVFLHEVRPGPASQSYGLEVARLAGLPRAVVSEARRLLAELERKAPSRHAQYDLFAAPQAEPAPESPPGSGATATDATAIDSALHGAARMLRDVDVDALSPRAALDLVYELKKRIDAAPDR